MDEVTQKLRTLSSRQIFSLSVFEEVIDEIRSTVAEVNNNIKFLPYYIFTTK